MLIEGGAFPAGKKVAVVAARFNEGVASRLLAGALGRLSERGFGEERVDVLRVPGAFEVPGAAKRLAETGRYAAVVCLGVLIRGETPHFDYISQACALGIQGAALSSGLPCAFGVLTCDTDDQAMDRVGGAFGHKGVEAVDAALEMAERYAAIAALSAGGR